MNKFSSLTSILEEAVGEQESQLHNEIQIRNRDIISLDASPGADSSMLRNDHELERLAKFTRFHPQPLLQISAEGLVLIDNIAASQLSDFFYEGRSMSAPAFYRELAQTLKKQADPQVIEAETASKSIQFHCNYNSLDATFFLTGHLSAAQVKCPSKVIDDIVCRLGPLMENLQDGILIEDENRKLLLTNSSFCTIFGITEKPTSLIGIDCWKLTRKAVKLFRDLQGFIDETKQLIRLQQHAPHYEIVLNDGRIIKREFIPIKNNTGTYMGNMWVFNDITHVSQANKTLENQRLFYETILNKLPADIAVYDMDHRYKYINPTSLKNDEIRSWIIGKTDKEYAIYRNKPLQMAELRKQHLEQVINAGKEIRWEEEAFDADGCLRTHLRILTPITDSEKQVQLVMGYGLEITDLKQVEQQVSLSEKRYRELINGSQGIIITHDTNGLIRSINPAVEKVLGFPSEFVIGQNLESFIPVEDREEFHTVYLSSLLEKGSVEGVLRIFNNLGKPIFLLYKNVLVNEAGAEPYVIGFSQDITERIHAEQELEVAKQVSEEGSRAKERFLANMSHEIRTPMNGIIGIANLLQKTTLDTEQKTFLSLILESASNLTVIINDILDLEKIIAGKLEFESIAFDVNEKVKLVADSFRYKAEEKDISLVAINALPSGLYVCGDPYRLTQILTNLISNAIKFTEFGQISISVDSENTTSEEVAISLCIKDSGIGISADKLVAIFDPYVQERSEISRKYGGTGLGLAICKNLVDMQGGTLSVESEPGKGSAFTIVIPYKRSKEQAKTKEYNPDYNLLINRQILVAEDVEINQFLVNHLLASWGCKVTIVSNGKEALAELISKHFDAVLMDIQMPVMDGIECTRHIRQIADQGKASIPIIALTANALAGDDEKYYSAGMNGYLTKPFKEIALYNILVESLQLHLPPGEFKRDSTITTDVENKQANQRLYDLSFLKNMSGDDKTFLPMMAKLFVDTAPGILQKIEEAIGVKDWKMVGSLAHKLKPTIDTMHITSLTQIIRSAEMNGKKEIEVENLPGQIHLIVTTLRDCIVQLKEEFGL